MMPPTVAAPSLRIASPTDDSASTIVPDNSPQKIAKSSSNNVPQQQRRPPLRSSFDLEPNPFEQSFSRSSNSGIKSSDDGTPDNRPPNQDQNSTNSLSADSAAAQSQVVKEEGPSDADPSASPKPTLPSLASIASSGPPTYSWGLTSAGITNNNSLRSGPLSPAMLSGPQQAHSTSSFDHSSFRTGLTPGTGLTPLVGGPASFPPPSPNTAAFLAMVTGATNSNSLASVAATITPNTLSALTGAVTNGGNPSGTPSQNGGTMNPMQYDQQHQQSGDPQSQAQTSAATAASTAANGLFLLSQAHQELTKREEAQARAGFKPDSNMGIDPSATNKRGAKRKVEEPTKGSSKKAKGPANGKRKKEFTPPSDSEEEDMEDMEEALTSANGVLNGKNVKEMTDEEKRKNFLERNRQAALKCRQRKKAWLSQLQAKVEFLTTENDRLTTALVSSREEISRLNALVGAHPPPPHMQNAHGHMQANGSHMSGGIAQNQQPVSVAVSLPGNGKNVMVGGHANHQVGVGNGNPPPQAGVTAGGSGRGYGY